MPRSSAISASREVPFSPAKAGSPARRFTRSTRNQSVDLDEARSRQGSVKSTASNNQQRSRMAARKTAGARDLYIVAEDREPLAEEKDEDQDGEDEEEEDPDATKVAEPSEYYLPEDDHESNQPDSSNFDAMSDTRINTPQTEQMMKSINSKSAVASLHDLYDTSCQVIKNFAKFPNGSKNGKRRIKVLQGQRKAFEAAKEPYRTEQFIDPKIVLKKIFDSKVPGDQATSLPAILHSANLATLAIVVNEQRRTRQDLDKSGPEKPEALLYSLKKSFPGSFVFPFTRALSTDPSDLIEESFDMFLDIRTQLFINASRRLENQPNFDPDRILAKFFLEDAEGKGNFDAINEEERKERTGERLDRIRDSFKPAEQATGPGKYIDFDRLDRLYPISGFYDNLISYSKKRLVEVETIIDIRGGIEHVIKPLDKLVEDIESESESESEISLQLDSPKIVTESKDSPVSKKVVPPQPSRKPRTSYHNDPGSVKFVAELTAKAGSQRLYDGEKSPIPDEEQKKDSQITSSLKEFHKSQNKENRSPNKHQGRGSTTKTSTRGMYRKNPNAEKVEWNEDSQGFLRPSPPRTNKRKNRLSSYVQTDDEELPQPRNNKRKAFSPDVPADNEASSSDQGFQNDQRKTVVPRRNAEPRPQDRPNKRARTEVGESSRTQNSRGGDKSREPSPILANDDDDDVRGPTASEQNQQTRERSQSQVSRISQLPPRAHSNSSVILGDNEDSVEQPSDDDEPPIPFTQTQSIARINAQSEAARVGIRRVQTREPWSDNDTAVLIRHIGDVGSNWAEIERRGSSSDGFERDNITQVNLKDRARNIKVSMLLAGEKLPPRFDEVKLNASLITRVKKTWPYYDPFTETGHGIE